MFSNLLHDSRSLNCNACILEKDALWDIFYVQRWVTVVVLSRLNEKERLHSSSFRPKLYIILLYSAR